MNYKSLRYQIYRNEIKQLLAAISRIGAVIAILFINVLIPVFLMAGLMAVGIIAAQQTTTAERIVYQAVYLVLLFALVKVQAKAIRGSAYAHYLNVLPVTAWQRIRRDLDLLVVAGNLVLLAPLALCFFLPDFQTLLASGYFVMFAVMVILLSFIALYRHNIPWLSLLITPCVAAVAMPEAGVLNCLWLIAIISELWLIDRLDFQRRNTAIHRYWQMLRLFVLHRPVNFLARALGSMALIAGYGYVINQRPDFALVEFQLAVCLPVALSLGSYQFEIERFRSQYRYYLLTLPLTMGYRRFIEALPLLLLALIAVLMQWQGFDFSPWALLFQLLMIALTAFGVSCFGKHYYLLPLLPGVLFIALKDLITLS